jgi:hypothetical protein
MDLQSRDDFPVLHVFQKVEADRVFERVRFQMRKLQFLWEIRPGLRYVLEELRAHHPPHPLNWSRSSSHTVSLLTRNSKSSASSLSALGTSLPFLTRLLTL